MNSQWRGRNERGSAGAIRLMIWLALHVGRPVCRALQVPICAYFFVTAPSTRRASQQFLTRALGRAATWRDTFTHLMVFSTTLLDRVYLLHGHSQQLSIKVSNEAALQQAMAAGRGCLLLGSHLGSFEMLGVVGCMNEQLTINVVMHVDDDGTRLRQLIDDANTSPPYKVIPLGRPGSMLRVKECLERGEIVGILADRVYAEEATQRLSFLGHPARFSLGPTRLARITGAPAVAVFGLFGGGRQYEIVFEALVQNEAASPAMTADGAVADAGLLAYVDCLERHARQWPYNWFNFFDYWRA